LYGRDPIDPGIVAVSPRSEGRPQPNPHMRWHPLRAEWVAYAFHRQKRTFLPPADFNPLAVTTNPEEPTELPPGDYDVAVFENLFPTFFSGAHDAPFAMVETKPARGACEVVVFTQDVDASLGSLPLDRVAVVLSVWADRTKELGGRADVACVFPFENRGTEVGATLRHPHGQIYAYPFVPPIIAREVAEQRRHWSTEGRALLADLLESEIAEGKRILYAGPKAIAWVPAFARYAYEIWIAPLEPRAFLHEATPEELDDLAKALKTALLKLDGLWGSPMPYVLSVHQAPTDGRDHPEIHCYIQILPALRMPGRLKYLAGSEIGAGAFTADTLPEEKAAELRAVEVVV